jgi:hypothetical protein
MINSIRLQFINWALMMLVMLVVCSLQTVVWTQFLGSITAPLLWLNVVLYVILHRKPVEAIFINYALGMVMSAFTSMSLGKIFLLLLILSSVGGYARARIFWPSLRYFIFASAAITLSFQITNFSISFLMDSNPIGFHPFQKILEILFTTFLATPTYLLMKKIDQVSQPEPMMETKASV